MVLSQPRTPSQEGFGQGSYIADLTIFTDNTITAGAGGAGGNSTHSAGGGAGGILINGIGPNADPGGAAFSGQGGIGYGAGGGGGGFNGGVIREAGGDGAHGLVYLEYVIVSIDRFADVSGNWDVASTWTPAGQPFSTDDAFIGGGLTVTANPGSHDALSVSVGHSAGTNNGGRSA